MSTRTKIQWCHHTFGWEGCTKVSEGCALCYAENRNRRFSAGANWGSGAPRKLPEYFRAAVASYDAGKRAGSPFTWNEAAAEANERRRVFPSLCDPFDEEAPPAFLAWLLGFSALTPHLDWLLLTKRPQNFTDRLCAGFEHVAEPQVYERSALARAAYTVLEGWIGEGAAQRLPANIWVGATAENQRRASERVPELLKIPAKIRFLSCEPLLGPIDLEAAYWGGNEDDCNWCTWCGGFKDHIRTHDCYDPKVGIDWVITGGESGGALARPMHVQWARGLRDQCTAADVPFFFKQWGAWQIWNGDDTPHWIGEDREFADAPMVRALGKVPALLDGREWKELPTC